MFTVSQPGVNAYAYSHTHTHDKRKWWLGLLFQNLGFLPWIIQLRGRNVFAFSTIQTLHRLSCFGEKEKKKRWLYILSLRPTSNLAVGWYKRRRQDFNAKLPGRRWERRGPESTAAAAAGASFSALLQRHLPPLVHHMWRKSFCFFFI